MRLDPSPIPKGKHTANSNRAYLSPDATVSISGHILFIRSEARDLRCAIRVPLISRSTTIFLVIPPAPARRGTGAEGPAVSADLSWKYFPSFDAASSIS